MYQLKTSKKQMMGVSSQSQQSLLTNTFQPLIHLTNFLYSPSFNYQSESCFTNNERPRCAVSYASPLFPSLLVSIDSLGITCIVLSWKQMIWSSHTPIPCLPTFSLSLGQSTLTCCFYLYSSYCFQWFMCLSYIKISYNSPNTGYYNVIVYILQ